MLMLLLLLLLLAAYCRLPTVHRRLPLQPSAFADGPIPNPYPIPSSSLPPTTAHIYTPVAINVYRKSMAKKKIKNPIGAEGNAVVSRQSSSNAHACTRVPSVPGRVQ
jgi:hypothetical protein